MSEALAGGADLPAGSRDIDGDVENKTVLKEVSRFGTDATRLRKTLENESHRDAERINSHAKATEPNDDTTWGKG